MISPRLDRDYASAVTDASRSVLLEVMTVLGQYRDALVLIGGWGPYFLLPQTSAATAGFGSQGKPFRHIGSIDIDLAVDPERITGEEYKTIVRLLQDRGYALDSELKHRLNRSVPGLPAPSGIEDVIARIKPNLGDAGLQKGLGKVREKFMSDKDAGPSWVANFFSAAQEAERAQLRQDAYLTVDRVLKGCGI